MTSPWPGRDEELRALFREGLTCESMAAVMGITKGMVVGRLHRLELYRERRQGPRKRLLIAPLGKPAELLKIDPDGCRWGIGEIVRHRHLMCNAPQYNGSAYCERHWRRSLGRSI